MVPPSLGVKRGYQLFWYPLLSDKKGVPSLLPTFSCNNAKRSTFATWHAVVSWYHLSCIPISAKSHQSSCQGVDWEKSGTPFFGTPFSRYSQPSVSKSWMYTTFSFWPKKPLILIHKCAKYQVNQSSPLHKPEWE